MTHEDAGRYAAKHPAGKIDPKVAEAIAEREKDGRITCAAAHAIAKKLAVSPQAVGMNIDLLEKRIRRCQMGLFGYDRKTGKKVKPAAMVTKKVEQAIRKAMKGDYLDCAISWQLAENMGLTKLELSAACEALGVKIKPCQLGAF